MNYKTLIKNIEKRNTIPILSQIAVQDGIAVSTDMDFWVSAPCDLPEGMYHPIGFIEGKNYKSDLPLEDFPFGEKLKKLKFSCKLDKEYFDPLKWVSIAASTEITRYYLNGIFFDKNKIVATDGHRCHTVDYKPDFKGKWGIGEILPNKAVKLIFDLLKETKSKEISLNFYEGSKFLCEIGNVSITGKTIDGTFPDYNRVFPDHPKKNKCTFNPEEFLPALEVCKDLTKIQGSKAYVVAVSENNIFVKDSYKSLSEEQNFKTGTAIKTKIGFNIHYLTDMCGGVLLHGDSSDPVIVSDRRGKVKKTGVLMPLRID